MATPYRSAYREPVVWPAGTPLRILPRSSEWDDWLWCADASGREAWVPSEVLDTEEGAAVLLDDYDSRELSVRAGDELVVLRSVAGWSWSRDLSGAEGWVPNDHLEAVT